MGLAGLAHEHVSTPLPSRFNTDSTKYVQDV